MGPAAWKSVATRVTQPRPYWKKWEMRLFRNNKNQSGQFFFITQDTPRRNPIMTMLQKLASDWLPSMIRSDAGTLYYTRGNHALPPAIDAPHSEYYAVGRSRQTGLPALLHIRATDNGTFQRCKEPELNFDYPLGIRDLEKWILHDMKGRCTTTSSLREAMEAIHRLNGERVPEDFPLESEEESCDENEAAYD